MPAVHALRRADGHEGRFARRRRVARLQLRAQITPSHDAMTTLSPQRASIPRSPPSSSAASSSSPTSPTHSAVRRRDVRPYAPGSRRIASTLLTRRSATSTRGARASLGSGVIGTIVDPLQDFGATSATATTTGRASLRAGDARRPFNNLDYCACEACRLVIRAGGVPGRPPRHCIDVPEHRRTATRSRSSSRGGPDIGAPALTCDEPNMRTAVRRPRRRDALGTTSPTHLSIAGYEGYDTTAT